MLFLERADRELSENIPVSPKIYLTLTLNFEAMVTLMLGILGFLISPDLYNSFDTLFIWKVKWSLFRQK